MCVCLFSQLGIEFEFVNIGGGLGIPYRPGEVMFCVLTMHSVVCAYYCVCAACVCVLARSSVECWVVCVLASVCVLTRSSVLHVCV